MKVNINTNPVHDANYKRIHKLYPQPPAPVKQTPWTQTPSVSSSVIVKCTDVCAAEICHLEEIVLWWFIAVACWENVKSRCYLWGTEKRSEWTGEDLSRLCSDLQTEQVQEEKRRCCSGGAQPSCCCWFCSLVRARSAILHSNWVTF